MAGINPVQRSGSFTATRPPRKPEVDPFKDNVQISERRATWGSRVRIKVKETVVNVADWVRREWVALKNDVDRAWQTVKSRASKAASPKETPKVSISVVPKAPDVIPSDPNLAALRVTQEGLKNEKEVQELFSKLFQDLTLSAVWRALIADMLSDVGSRLVYTGGRVVARLPQLDLERDIKADRQAEARTEELRLLLEKMTTLSQNPPTDATRVEMKDVVSRVVALGTSQPLK